MVAHHQPSSHRLARATDASLPAPLLQSALEGDRAALGAVLRRVAGPMLKVIRVLLEGYRSQCEDVLQESLIALAESLPQFRGDSSLQSYAVSIAARRAIHWRRAQRRQQQGRQLSIEGSADPSTSEARPDQEYYAQERRHMLLQLLAELPEEQAQTLGLRVVLGLTLREVADATGVPLNTVRSRIRLAREALSRRMNEDTQRFGGLEAAGEID